LHVPLPRPSGWLAVIATGRPDGRASV